MKFLTILLCLILAGCADAPDRESDPLIDRSGTTAEERDEDELEG
jgi:hypothetical protein